MTVDDVLFIVVLIFVFSISTLVAARGFYELNTNDGISGIFANDTTGVASSMINKGTTTIQSFDYLILLSFFMYIMVTLILAFLAPTNPVFFVLSFLVVSIHLIIITFFENMFRFFIQNDVIAVIITDYPLTRALFENITIIMWVYAALLLIIMFGGARKIVGISGR